MDTILIITTIQAWFFMTLILSTKPYKQTYDYLLSAWLFVIGLHTLFHYLLHSGDTINIYLAIINAAIPFLQGPFLFLYVKTRSGQTNRLSWIDGIHFIPFLAFLCYQLINTQLIMGQADDSNNVFIGFFEGVNLFGTFFLVSLPLYLGLSYRVSSKANTNYPETALWIKMLILFVLGIWVSAVISQLAPKFMNHTFQIGFNSLVFVALTGFVYLISYFGIKQNIFRTDIPKIGGDKYKKSKVLDEEADRIWIRLQDYIEKEAPYLNPDLDLNHLSAQVDISAHKLSQIINSKADLSFNDFINKYRIEEVKQMMYSPEHAHLSILGMALEAGFTSKATFNRVFKKLENCTPTQYRDQQKS